MSTQHDTGALFYITDISQSSFAENAPEHDDETDPKVLRTTVDDGKQELSQQCILGFEIPKLQSPKECHLFVASSSDDREQVLKIVEELENQFAIKCLFASRDFQPGKEYRLMIRDGIDTSLKVLLIFTPNFVESPFCQLEAELAYIMSIERKNDCVIPVLLENCEVPATLKPRNYIDATQPGMDIRALTIKIMEALVRIESPTNVVPFKFCRDDGEAENENGSYVDIHAVKGRSRKWAIKLSSYQFYLRRSDMREIEAKKINANPKLLKRTMELLNEDTATRRYHLLNGSWPWMMGFGTCPFTLFVCLAIFLGSLLFESTAHPSEEVASFVRAGHWVAWVPFAIGGAITFPLIGYWYTMKKKTEKGISELKSKLWNEITSAMYKDNVLFSLVLGNVDTLPTRYIMMLLRRQEPDEKTDQDLEIKKARTFGRLDITKQVVADGIIQEYLKRVCTTDYNLAIFPKAEYKRHDVAGSRMCICQRYESLKGEKE